MRGSQGYREDGHKGGGGESREGSQEGLAGKSGGIPSCKFAMQYNFSSFPSFSSFAEQGFFLFVFQAQLTGPRQKPSSSPPSSGVPTT